MRKVNLLLVLLILFLGSCRDTKTDSPPETNKHVDIFLAENFINEQAWQQLFQNLDVNLHRFSSSLKLAKALQQNPKKADLVIGLDNTSCGNLDLDSLFVRPELDIPLQKNLKLEKSGRLIPYGFNYLALIYPNNSEHPVSFGEMQDPNWYKSIILPNAESSTVGKGVLLWTIALFNHGGYRHFWRSIDPNIKITTSSFEEAYDMFLSGESQFILGYSTLPFYHNEQVGKQELSSVIPAEGSYKIIKFAAITQNCSNKIEAEQILKHILSAEFQQNKIPQMFMHPARSDVSYKIKQHYIELPTRDVTWQLPLKIIDYNEKIYLSRWQDIIEQ
jgi:thiamine transport system substrate-binding protein